ncbi:hypothetical protein [uncultured Hymenobacter sp.]|uniref:hypothetical protein n=1 Tax=uncultured Hymenobacter sp. TaxID=170016 RepID=UPI0035CA080D
METPAAWLPAVRRLCLLRGFDDTCAQDINARSSYRYDELRWNYCFVRPYRSMEQTGEILPDLSLILATEGG